MKPTRKKLLTDINKSLLRGDNKKAAIRLGIPLSWGITYVSNVRSGRATSSKVLKVLFDIAMENREKEMKMMKYLESCQ